MWGYILSFYVSKPDLVQIASGPIGAMIDEIRTSLNWLGEPVRKLTEHSAKLIYRYLASDGTQRKLKIEINTTEHYHVFDLVDQEFSVKNSWFTGTAFLRTYQLNELMGTKIRALYQRRKGRDLFDLCVVLKENIIDINITLEVFLAHCSRDNLTISRALFEKNLYEKSQVEDFRNDMVNLLSGNDKWSFEQAYELVSNQLIPLLPGDAWKKT